MIVINVVTKDERRIQVPIDHVDGGLFKTDPDFAKTLPSWQRGAKWIGCYDYDGDIALVCRKSDDFGSISESIEEVDFPRGYYEFYMKTERWKEKRKTRLLLDFFRCSICGTAKNLQVHHVNYENVGNENLEEDLVTLCRKCHAKVHEMDLTGKEE